MRETLCEALTHPESEEQAEGVDGTSSIQAEASGMYPFDVRSDALKA